MKTKKIYRNRNCKECPQNEREDVVWKKGYEDGKEAGLYWAKQVIMMEIEKQRRK